MKLNTTWFPTRAFSPYLFSALLFLIVACSKGKANNIIARPPINSNTPPLPNTVDKSDTLQVMAYNVLNYGDDCQGSTSALDVNFKTIIQYVQPDLLSCEKMYVFDPTPGATGNLADDINNNVLNAAFPGHYAYAAPTNAANAGDMSVLFYNQQKLSFVSRRTLVVNVTDFNLYKFYYNDPNLSITRDTTWLYVVVNHTQSGSNSAIRDQQVTREMQAIRNEFGFLPNLINMGDFNTRSSQEAGYQAIVTFPDTTSVMNDPPFSVEKTVQYPANWDGSPNLYAPYLTTSTRLSATLPNSCGTSGGAKSWYDHIFISPWLVKSSNYIQYMPGSYRTIGNDGQRLGVDINSQSPAVNTSAPAPVIQALWQFSNKYPVTIRLVVKANRNAYSPADPVEQN
jgi:hypothetical protein